MKITFWGAAEEVTGSKYLVEEGSTKILVDCGLLQGDRATHARNWTPPPFEPSSINAIVLTHAHIDHTGYIPVFVKNGFRGPIYCSDATRALCSVLLIDCGNVLEQEAKKAAEKQKSEQAPAPLYTIADAQNALSFFKSVAYDSPVTIGSLQVTFIRSGHILGSSFVVISNGKETLTFSGDLARPHPPLLKAPPAIKQTDFLVLESTYGNRLHAKDDPLEFLRKAIIKTVQKGGVLIIPSFAVDRTQIILYCLYQLRQKNAIPALPIFLDSPMAIKVTELYCAFESEHTLSAQLCQAMSSIATCTPTVQESKELNHMDGPAIIIAGSGMATGGRVLHHFKHRIRDSRNTVLFVGYQAHGTLGQLLVKGAKDIELDGEWYRVHATIQAMDMFSAHADYNEILQWLSHFEKKPQKVFLTHGELESAQALKKKIEERFGWTVVIPGHGDLFPLSPDGYSETSELSLKEK